MRAALLRAEEAEPRCSVAVQATRQLGDPRVAGNISRFSIRRRPRWACGWRQQQPLVNGKPIERDALKVGDVAFVGDRLGPAGRRRALVALAHAPTAPALDRLRRGRPTLLQALQRPDTDPLRNQPISIGHAKPSCVVFHATDTRAYLSFQGPAPSEFSRDEEVQRLRPRRRCVLLLQRGLIAAMLPMSRVAIAGGDGVRRQRKLEASHRRIGVAMLGWRYAFKDAGPRSPGRFGRLYMPRTSATSVADEHPRRRLRRGGQLSAT